jgi:predicted amino acid racemase
MFLEPLVRRNTAFLETAIRLHQEGRIRAGSYVLDLDTIKANAELIASEAKRLGLTVFAMTKQFGRNPKAMAAITAGGIDKFVAVDMGCARPICRHGFHLGHIGHLVQIPRAEAGRAAAFGPDYWTLYNLEKAREASEACATIGRRQKVLLRIHAPKDRFYSGHEGGFDVDGLPNAIGALSAMPGLEVAGITTFPALLFDEKQKAVLPTHNLATLERTAETLHKAGLARVEVNAPGTNSVTVLKALADAGATQVEPGHGLTGTAPLHAIRDLPEQPAILYLSEVSHFHAGRAYFYGGGLYIDPVFPDYPLKALVGADPQIAFARRVPALIPLPSMIDYYGQLDMTDHQDVRIGDTVILAFRPQVFFTRASVTPVSGIATGAPTIEGLWSSDGRPEQPISINNGRSADL